MPDAKPHLLLTCEHGGNRVPGDYRTLFAGRDALLASHRGWDPGALQLARCFARAEGAPLVFSEVSRLVVELNRSPHHPEVFSAITRKLDAAARERLLARHYRPYRKQVTDQLASLLKEGPEVIHLSVHTFTPLRQGQRRSATIGLLYDPQRPREKKFCDRWAHHLHHSHPRLTVKRNYPYHGTDDGFTTTLREVFDGQLYAGIEIEVNQAVVRRPAWFSSLSAGLAETLGQTLRDRSLAR